jgi:hypothetical protein
MATYQDNWRWCDKCQGIFFGGQGAPVCPAGGNHNIGSTNYKLAHTGKPSENAQEGWRWCNKCHAMFYGKASTKGVCAKGGQHDDSGSGSYWGHTAKHGGAQSQEGWRWCSKCQAMFFGDMQSSSKCPAGGSHDSSGSGAYVMAYTEAKASAPVENKSAATYQDGWCYCSKCMNFHFGGAGGGKCQAGGAHDKSASYNYKIPHTTAPGHKAQENWRWCKNCHSLVFGGAGGGNCPNGGSHDVSASYNYHLGQEAHTGKSQEKWNWCKNCNCLFFGDLKAKSLCSANKGNHDNSASYSYHVAH